MAKTNTLLLTEIVEAHVARHKPGGGWHPAQEVEVGDLIVNAGRSFIASRIAANSPDPISHMAVGTVNTAAALANTTLTGEVARKTLAINSAITNNLYTAVCTWGGFADSVTSLQLREAGLFNASGSGAGTMLQRVTFSTVTLADSDFVSITLKTNVGSNTIV